MPRTKLPAGSVPVTFRLPRQVQEILVEKARREKISFSELLRRALRRQIGIARSPIPPNER
jgi:predicted HicB family RNase H-like nuclease